MQGPDLTIVICTRDRAESLQLTLRQLAGADRSGLQIETIVVDNGDNDRTRQVVDEVARELPVRYLREPALGCYGKSHALNRAVNSDRLGEMIAVLDDDMSVESGWCQGVRAISRRWPEADLFTGSTYVVWPTGHLPAWALHPRIQGWLFSACESSTADKPLAEGRWFPGGHFWFRSRVLGRDRRFEDTWLTEPYFMMQLVMDGYRGVQGSDAGAGHRVQPSLLDPEVALQRAQKTGQGFADVRLNPRFKIRHSRLALKHRGLARTYAAAQWLRWCAVARLRSKAATDSFQFGDRLIATEREANFRETRRILARIPEYKLIRRKNRATGTVSSH